MRWDASNEDAWRDRSVIVLRPGGRDVGGGTTAHDMTCNNLRAALHAGLRGKACRPQGPDLKVKAGRNGRYPDALIDRGPLVPSALVAQEPVAVFEVLSASTAWIDQGLKLRDYDATPSIRYYVLISQDERRAMVYTRDAGGRAVGRAECCSSGGGGGGCRDAGGWGGSAVCGVV